MAFLLSQTIFNATLTAEKMASMKLLLASEKMLAHQKLLSSSRRQIYSVCPSFHILISYFVLLLYSLFSLALVSTLLVRVVLALSLSIASVCQIIGLPATVAVKVDIFALNVF